MKRLVLINDTIASWTDASAAKIRALLAGVQRGEEVEFQFSSPGGSVFEGVEMFNVIRDFVSAHDGPVTFRIIGMAASAASYLFVAGKLANPKVKNVAHENSIFFVHNPWAAVIGDYREMAKQADWSARLAQVFADAYSRASGQSVAAMRGAMDAETYYIGEEIVSAGFADALEKADGLFAGEGDAPADRDALKVNARVAMNAAMEAVKAKTACAAQDLEKYAAMLPPKTGAGENAPARGITSAQTDEGGKIMNKEELKAKHPDLYAEVFEEGRAAGIGDERSRVNAHIKMGETVGDLAMCAGFIKGGKAASDADVFAEYQAAALKKTMLAARIGDNPGDTHTAGSTGAESGREETLAALDRELKGALNG
jgi:ATP-dependent protease ClpP protease subunit